MKFFRACNVNKLFYVILFFIIIVILFHIHTTCKNMPKLEKENTKTQTKNVDPTPTVSASRVKNAEIKMEENIKIYRKELRCFFNDSLNKLTVLDEKEPKPGEGIFFHESFCPANTNDIKFSFRQACTVESALIAHKENDVFLLISSPITTKASDTKNIYVKELLSYPNFKIRHLNFQRHLSNTPLQKLYDSRALNGSRWPTVHASDMLRYATLLKFGGTYLDLDVIALKSLSNLSNFAGSESTDSINNAVMNFSFDRVGRKMAEECAQELARTFNPNLWAYNGPGVITRVLRRNCNTNKTLEMTEEKCNGFHVYPESYFYPVNFKIPRMLFENGKTEKVKQLIKNSYIVHVFSHETYVLSLKGSDIPYMKLAEQYCPKSFQTYQKFKREDGL